MRSIILLVLSLVVGFVAAASPAGNARSLPSKRFATPVEARAASHVSPRYVARSKPSPRNAARSKPSPRNVARSKPSPRNVARSKPSPRNVARSHPSPRSAVPSKRAIIRRDTDEQTTLKSLDSILCPLGMSACPVEPTSSLPNSLAEWAGLDHECVEFDSDLQSCGGCASVDISHDCTAITGAVTVACHSGGCQVQSCATGYVVSSDSRSCIAK